MLVGAGNTAYRSLIVARWYLRCTGSPETRRMKHTVVYAMGEGWTGALGTGRWDQSVPGHLDDDHFTSNNDPLLNTPVVLFDSSKNAQHPMQEQRLRSCAVGWGHTALLVESKIPFSIDNEPLDANKQQIPNDNDLLPSTVTFKTSTHLLLTGRPHEFVSLLRLKRMPHNLRQWVTYLTYRTIQRSKIAETMEDHPDKDVIWLNPIDAIGRTLSYLSKLFGNPETEPNWSAARDQTFLIEPTTVPLPFNNPSSPSASTTSTALQVQDDFVDVDPAEIVRDDTPIHVTCSAGFTALTTELGYVYTFGLNGIGQCGIGTPSNNVWEPSRVTGLSREFSGRGFRATALQQSYPIQQTALGLQHGLCLNIEGEMFAWGKGDRGQLGNDSIDTESHTGMPITKALLMNDDYTSKVGYHALGKISQISAGLIHSAAFEEETNIVYIWGKHVLPYQADENRKSRAPSFWNFVPRRRKIASDARIPVQVKGLPPDLKVLRIACGSHHTAILLEDGSVWAMGITTDTKRLHHAKCIVEAGVIDLTTLTQFTAHMDRTTIVFDGQVLQVHLWDDPEYQSMGVFTPAWVDQLLLHDPTIRIREVHRSWLHSVVVTEVSPL